MLSKSSRLLSGSITYAVNKSIFFFFDFSKWNVRNELSRWQVDTDAVLVFPGRVTNFSVLRHFQEEILKMLKLFIVRVHGAHSWKQSTCGTLRYRSLKYFYFKSFIT